MTERVKKNIIQFYSKLEPFCVAEKYADVTIKCDSKYFKCHRLALAAASDLFDTMFDDKAKQSKEMSVLIQEVSAETLSYILQFIYTGNVSVTSANVCNLFKASKFFALTGISDLCLEFVKCNKMTVNSTLEMFSLACLDKNKTLMDILIQDIVSQFKVFARASMFLEMPFNDFKIILDKLFLSSTNEEALLGAVFQWLLYCQEERSHYFKELRKFICFGNISTEVVSFITSKLYMNSDAEKLGVETVDPVGYDKFTAVPRKAVSQSTSSAKKLRLYVKYTKKNYMKVYSIDSEERFTSSGEIHLKDASNWIWTIALDDHLYSMHYSRRNSKIANNKQKFCAYTSIDMDSLLVLNAPPIILGDINLCRGQNNNIYTYHQTLFQPLIKTDSPCSEIFTDEEINCGIYLYNADLDIWLPVPPMKKKLEDVCMTTYNDSLYLIGGTSDLPDTRSGTFVQTYDYCEGRWQELPRTNYDRIGADCCLHNGKIYICGGTSQATSVERYDPQKGIWECLEEKMNVGMQYHQLISYCNKLWAIGSFIPGSLYINSPTIQSYPNSGIYTFECNDCTSSDYYYCDSKDIEYVYPFFSH